MSLSIGTASLKLVANGDKLTAGLAQSKASIRTWAGQAQETIASRFAGAGGLIKAGLLGGMVGIGAAIGGKIASSFGEFTTKADAVAKLSRNLGLSTESMSGLAHAADLSGVSMDSLKTGFAKFRQQVSGPLDEALYAFADRLQGIQDPGERAKALVEAFGKSGVQLGSMFEAGGDGLKGMVDEAKKLGIAFNEADAKKVEDANDAFTRMKASISGIFQRGIITFAPVFQTITDGFSKLLGKLRPVFDWIGRTTEAVFAVVGPVSELTIDAISDGISFVAELFSGIFSFAGQMPTIGEVIRGIFHGVGKAIAYVVDTVRALGGGIAIVASFAVGAFGEVVHAIGQLIEVAAELPEQLGGGMFKNASDAVKRFGLDSTNAAERMKNWGANQIEGFGNSARQVDAWFEQLSKKRKAETMAAQNDFALLSDSAAKPMKSLLGGAIEQGSKDEFSVRAKWESEGKILQSEQQKANALLGQIKNELAAVKSAIAAIPALATT